MSLPDIPNAVELHSAVKVTGATGAILSSVNVLSVVRNGVGDYTVNLGTDIDPSTRVAKVQAINAAARGASIDTETDSSLQVLMFDGAGAAADSDFYLEVRQAHIL